MSTQQAFVNDDPAHLRRPASCPTRRVVISVYSSGAIGRLVPEDVIGLIRFLLELLVWPRTEAKAGRKLPAVSPH